MKFKLIKKAIENAKEDLIKFDISLSEKLRASLEISNFINEKVGLNGPTFIDNSESITHYNNEFKNQVIFSKVVEKERLRLDV